MWRYTHEDKVYDVEKISPEGQATFMLIADVQKRIEDLGESVPFKSGKPSNSFNTISSRKFSFRVRRLEVLFVKDEPEDIYNISQRNIRLETR